MKKVLFFAFALVASVLAFTSCKGNKIDSPIVGTWKYATDPTPDSGWWTEYTFTFGGDGMFSLLDVAHPGTEEVYDGFIYTGSYEINGDIITLHKNKMGEYSNGQTKYYQDYEPNDERMKFSLTGNKLTLTREYGTDYAWEEVYTKQ